MGSALHLRAARRLARIEAWERAIPLLERLKRDRLSGGVGPGMPLAVSMLRTAIDSHERMEGVRLYNTIHPEAIDELCVYLAELMKVERDAAIDDLIEMVYELMDRHHQVLVGEAVAVRDEMASPGTAHPHEATPRPVG